MDEPVNHGLVSGPVGRCLRGAARYLTYRFWARCVFVVKRDDAWRGHGGIRAIIVGLLAVFGSVSLMVANNEAILATIPEEQQAIIAASLA